MKSQLKVAGLCAAIATTAAQAEVKINENLSLDGYAIGAGVVTEGTPAKNDALVDSGNVFDSVLVAANGKYQDFSARVSLYSVNSSKNSTDADSGVLDAYVTYKAGDLSITGGKYLGWLGYESFHSPNNAFITFSQVNYKSPYATGLKVDYAGEGFSTGVSARDSQIANTGSFYEGDGEIDDDIGYEAYFLYSAIKGFSFFAGAGYEDVDGGDQTLTTDFWASYAVTEQLGLAAEFATTEDVTKSSWLLQAAYAVTPELSVAGRVTGIDGDNNSADAFGYGVASTYTFTPNFSLKGEVTKLDSRGGSDQFQYALQGLFRF